MKMKANRKQTAVKLTARKIGTHLLVRVAGTHARPRLHRSGQIFARMNFVPGSPV